MQEIVIISFSMKIFQNYFLLLLLLLSHFSRVRLYATPSLGFSRQEHWSGLPFPSPMHKSEKWKWSRSVVSDSSRPHGLKRLLCPWDFPGKGTGVGCHCLLRFLTTEYILDKTCNKLLKCQHTHTQGILKKMCFKIQEIQDWSYIKNMEVGKMFQHVRKFRDDPHNAEISVVKIFSLIIMEIKGLSPEQQRFHF